MVDEYIRQLSDLGISLHSLKLLGDFEIPEEDRKLTERELIEKILTDSSYKEQKKTIERYISEFVRADLITQATHLRRGKDLVNPYNDNLIDGGVYIYRTPEKDKDGNMVQTGEGEYIKEVDQEKYVQMTYIAPEKFQELVNSNSPKLRYKYTIDENGYIEVAKMKTVVTKTKSSSEIFGSTDKTTTVEDILHIDYKQYIEKYTMPYEFLINLCMITQNPEFVYHVAMLARQTEIILVVQDDTTIVDEIRTEVRKIQSFKNTSSSSREGAEVTEESTETFVTETITTEMTPHLEIKQANTWSFYEKFEYTKTVKVEGPNTQGPVSGPCNVQDTLPNYYPGTPETITLPDGTTQTVTTGEYWTGGPWIVENKVTTSTTKTTTEYRPGIRVDDPVEKSKQFLGLLRNETGECKEANCYNSPKKVQECVKKAEFYRDGFNVEYAIPNSTNVDAPLNRLISGLQMLYQLLGEGLQGDTGNEKKDEINSEYKTRMTGIIDHIKYLMTFPENEDIDIQYEDDEEDSIDIPEPDIEYEEEIEDEELEILYKICEAEAGGSSEPEIGHVACVILNRVKCSQWPNTIKEVVFQKNQFQPIRNGMYEKAIPSEKTKKAINSVLASGDTTGGAVYFRTEASAISAGMPISKDQKHKSYIYLFTDPNTHVFHTNAKALEELRGITGGTTPATGKLEDIFPDGIPTTQEGIRKYLTTIQVPITKKNGTKTTAPVTIHRAVAEDLKNVLQKAQDGGFKVYSIGGFSWRNVAHSSKMSQHALGLAVDINVTENYCVYPDTGKIDAGSFWDPSRSEYSIPKDGVLVKAFKSIGWGWGGDWKSKKDYMHFSFTGN